MLVLGVDDILELSIGEILSRPRVLMSSSRSLFFAASSKFSIAAFVYYSSICYTIYIIPFPSSFASISLNYFS
jgi:hypothetical protein